MGRAKAYFLQLLETDPAFRRAVALAELRQIEPELPVSDAERERVRQEAQPFDLEPFEEQQSCEESFNSTI